MSSQNWPGDEQNIQLEMERPWHVIENLQKVENLNVLFHICKWLFIFTSLQQIRIKHLLYVPTIISNYMANKGR